MMCYTNILKCLFFMQIQKEYKNTDSNMLVRISWLPEYFITSFTLGPLATIAFFLLYYNSITKYDTKNAMEYNTVRFGIKIQYNTIQYNTIQHNTIQYNTTQYNTTQNNTKQHNTLHYNTIQYKTIQHNIHNIIKHNTIHTIQYNTEQYNTINTIQYNTKQYNPINTIQYNTINTIKYNTKQYNTINTIQYKEAKCIIVLLDMKSHSLTSSEGLCCLLLYIIKYIEKYKLLIRKKQ